MTQNITKTVPQAVSDVMQMLMLEGYESKDSFELKDAKKLGDICAVIGLGGDTVAGYVLIHFSQKMVLAVTEAILGVETSEITPEVLDAAGEVTNIISGSIKTASIQNGEEDFSITVPTVVAADLYKKLPHQKTPSLVFSFEKDSESYMNVEIRLG